MQLLVNEMPCDYTDCPFYKEKDLRGLTEQYCGLSPNGFMFPCSLVGENPYGDEECIFLKVQKQTVGEWIENAPEGQDIDPPYICSICGHAESTRTPFCEQCGADMRQKDSEEE